MGWIEIEDNEAMDIAKEFADSNRVTLQEAIKIALIEYKNTHDKVVSLEDHRKTQLNKPI